MTPSQLTESKKAEVLASFNADLRRAGYYQTVSIFEDVPTSYWSLGVIAAPSTMARACCSFAERRENHDDLADFSKALLA